MTIAVLQHVCTHSVDQSVEAVVAQNAIHSHTFVTPPIEQVDALERESHKSGYPEPPYFIGDAELKSQIIYIQLLQNARGTKCYIGEMQQSF